MTDCDRLIENLKLNDLTVLPEIAKTLERSKNIDTIKDVHKTMIRKGKAVKRQITQLKKSYDSIAGSYYEFLTEALKGTYAEIPVTISHKKQGVFMLGWNSPWLYGKVSEGHKIAVAYQYTELDRENNFNIYVREVNKKVNQSIGIDLDKYLLYMVQELTDPNYKPIETKVEDLWGDIPLP
jgi:hypothetical protein